MRDEDLKKKRYELLAQEVESAFPKLMKALENGVGVVTVSDESRVMAADFAPENLVLIGGMVKICLAHNATVMFTTEKCSALSAFQS